MARLTAVYQEKKAAPRNRSKAARIQKCGAMQFHEYTAEWKAGQRDLTESSVRTLESLLEHHILPTLGSRRMSTFDHQVVDGFIRTMERNGAGLATQSNAFDKVKSVLLDAYRLGIYTENPVPGVKPPQYDPEHAVIPHYRLRRLRNGAPGLRARHGFPPC
ncbi:tyrosine-type recombinase/integrase [Streptomyces sp. NPDC054946]